MRVTMANNLRGSRREALRPDCANNAITRRKYAELFENFGRAQANQAGTRALTSTLNRTA
jgi:hypothetical protein